MQKKKSPECATNRISEHLNPLVCILSFMAKTGGKKRAAPEPSDEYAQATWVENAEWNFNKSNWTKKGEPEYKKLIEKDAKGRTLTGYERHLLTVHFPKLASAVANKRTKKAAEPVFGDALTQVYHHYLELSDYCRVKLRRIWNSCEIKS